MIRLKNVSKFYYRKGVIASGFTKINLEFNMGEFVAITGESGSGKSTLLNVISGLDTYEEGEMYINGKETSHYSEKDFEDYRRKYISNIFQNFNLINSYTVYQNVELVLLLNGYKKKDVKDKVIDLIKKVGLYKFRNTKVSKLSGGQKQRVAIARALAKETPIIIADEPTGNLDSKSAKEIIKLLHDISKDKLVIIVTHNYDQVEDYVTRKIKMHDGKVLEDKKIKDTEKVKNKEDSRYRNITFLNEFRLSLRNTFNIIPKFVLLLLVYLFITTSVISEYASRREQKYIVSKQGYNEVFSNTDDKRIIVKKKDNSALLDEDYNKISSIKGIKSIVKNDLFLDTNISLSDDENFWISGNLNEIKNLPKKVDLGRLPENENEIVIEGSKDDYYVGVKGKELLNKNLYLVDYNTDEVNKTKSLKVVGIKYSKELFLTNIIYLSDSIRDELLFQTNENYSDIKILFMDKYYTKDDEYFNVKLNNNVPEGNVYINSELSYLCPKENCKNQNLRIEVKNLYYEDSVDLNTNIYNKYNIKKLFDTTFEDGSNNIYLNPNDYNKLFNKGNYQSSVFVKDVKYIDDVVKELDKDFKVLEIRKTLVTSGSTQITEILSTVLMIILLVVLFFISYFVISIILKSRNVYYSTIRMLGATKNVCKKLLIEELFIVSNISYFVFIAALYMHKLRIINISFLNTVLRYLTIKDYIILYIIINILSYLISKKYSKKLFKKSAITTINEEA